MEGLMKIIKIVTTEQNDPTSKTVALEFKVSNKKEALKAFTSACDEIFRILGESEE